MSRSSTLFSESVPVRLPTFSWSEKQLKGRHFSSDVEAIAATGPWLDGQNPEIYFEWLANVKATG
jgi:hypothetical protein